MPELERRLFNKNTPPARSGQFLRGGAGRHHEQSAMGWAITTRHIVRGRAETDRLSGKDRFEWIAASLREQHLRSDLFRDRGPLEVQRRLPEQRVGRTHFRQIVHRQACGRHHIASIAARTRSGVNGISVSRAPTASWIALAMALATPSIPASPMPFAPNGPGPPCSRMKDS